MSLIRLLPNKMKKLLILVDKYSDKKKYFTKYLSNKMGEGYEVTLAQFIDLIFFVNEGQVEVLIDSKNLSLKEFDLVYFRRAGTKLSLAGSLALCLESLGVTYIDSVFKDLGPARDKFTSLTKLALNGLPIMPTYFCWHTKILEKREEIIKKLGLPLVAKQLSSQRGKGIYLLKNKEDFLQLEKDYPEQEFLFQKYFENDEEYRVLVLGDKIGAYERKIRTDKKEFRSNVALGAREEFIDINDIPFETKEIAVKACKILSLDIGGVDILVDRNNKKWLLEVNRGPGLTYEPSVSPELDNLVKYFTHKLEEKNG